MTQVSPFSLPSLIPIIDMAYLANALPFVLTRLLLDEIKTLVTEQCINHKLTLLTTRVLQN